MKLSPTTALLWLSLPVVLAAAGCRNRSDEAAPASRKAAPSEAASAKTTSASAAAPASIGGVPLTEMALEQSKQIEKKLAAIGWRPMAGCGQATVTGRSLTCTFGENPVTVRIEQKGSPKVVGSDVKVGTRNYANGVVASDGKVHVIVYAGDRGSREQAQAAMNALWDAKAKTFGGTKLASLTARSLEPALETKGYDGWSWDPERLFAFREAWITVRKDDPAKLEGTVFEDPSGARLAVHVVQRSGADADAEKRLIDVLLAK